MKADVRRERREKGANELLKFCNANNVTLYM